MDDLEFNIQQLADWFTNERELPYVLVRVSAEHVRLWPDALSVPVRRCYVTDSVLDLRAAKLNKSKSEILSARLPDAGSTMAGDFGEILVYLYLATRETPRIAFGPKKWRLKQDRTKPAPHSDVLHFLLPTWPTPSAEDVLLCSEVKTKSTAGNTTPVLSAIEDCAKDRTSRLARTLVWLRERALGEDLGDVTIAHLDRFINAIDYPRFARRFHAVAVICSSLLDTELASVPAESPADYKIIVIAIPGLHGTYTSVFEEVRKSLVAPVSSVGGSR